MADRGHQGAAGEGEDVPPSDPPSSSFTSGAGATHTTTTDHHHPENPNSDEHKQPLSRPVSSDSAPGTASTPTTTSTKTHRRTKTPLSEYFDDTSIPLPSNLAQPFTITGIFVDIGGSLAKLAYYTKNSFRSNSIGDEVCVRVTLAAIALSFLRPLSQWGCAYPCAWFDIPPFISLSNVCGHWREFGQSRVLHKELVPEQQHRG